MRAHMGVWGSLFSVFSSLCFSTCFLAPGSSLSSPFVVSFPCWPMDPLADPRKRTIDERKKNGHFLDLFSFLFHYNSAPSPPLGQERDHALSKNQQQRFSLVSVVSQWPLLMFSFHLFLLHSILRILRTLYSFKRLEILTLRQTLRFGLSLPFSRWLSTKYRAESLPGVGRAFQQALLALVVKKRMHFFSAYFYLILFCTNTHLSFWCRDRGPHPQGALSWTTGEAKRVLELFCSTMDF